jgi:hypothetical protein
MKPAVPDESSRFGCCLLLFHSARYNPLVKHALALQQLSDIFKEGYGHLCSH